MQIYSNLMTSFLSMVASIEIAIETHDPLENPGGNPKDQGTRKPGYGDYAQCMYMSAGHLL